MSDEKWLRQAAEEIRKEGHYGWGNTCEQAADRIAELEAENQRLRGGIANAMLCDSVVQMHECLTALLGGGE